MAAVLATLLIPRSVDAASSLSNGSVTPGSGTTATVFVFRVDYASSNPERDPQSVIARVGDEQVALSPTGAPANGTYQGSATLPVGSWTVTFEAEVPGPNPTWTRSAPIAVTSPSTPPPTAAPTPAPTPKPTTPPTAVPTPRPPAATPRPTPRPTEQAAATPGSPAATPGSTPDEPATTEAASPSVTASGQGSPSDPPASITAAGSVSPLPSTSAAIEPVDDLGPGPPPLVIVLVVVGGTTSAAGAALLARLWLARRIGA